MTAAEVEKAREKRDRLLRHLRVELRRVVAQLTRDRRFAVFMRPVNRDEAPDYYDVIRQPMSLGIVRAKIDEHQYTSVKEFAKVCLCEPPFVEISPPPPPMSLSSDIFTLASVL